MSGASDSSPWYRLYALVVIIAACIHNVAVRDAPIYLVTVQVPGCEISCQGQTPTPLCDNHKWTLDPLVVERPREDCEICRARIVSTARQKAALPGSVSLGFTAANLRMSRPIETDIPYIEVPYTLTRQKDANYYNMQDGSCVRRWEYGVMIGYAWGLSFAVGSVLAGFVVDTRDRVEIASSAFVAWSVATALQAASHDFWFLICLRAGSGAAQAFIMPAGISLIVELFGKANAVPTLSGDEPLPSDSWIDRHITQTSAVMLISLGLYAGAASASLSIIFAEMMGWRWVVLLSGLIGILLAAVFFFTVREPQKVSEWSAPCALRVVYPDVFEKRVCKILIVAASAKMLAGCTLAAYLPLWYARHQLDGFTSSGYACWNAAAILGGGLLTTFLGGQLGRIWSPQDNRAPCWIGLAGSVLSVPLIVMVLYSQSFYFSLFCYFLLLCVGDCWFVPSVALLQAAVRRSVSGQAVTMFFVAAAVIAHAGPALVGFFDPGSKAVRHHMLWISVTANVIAFFAFYAAAREISIDPPGGRLASSADKDDCVPVREGTPNTLRAFL